MSELIKCELCNDTGIHEQNIPATETNPVEADVEVYCSCYTGQMKAYDQEIYYFGYSHFPKPLIEDYE